MYVHSTFEIPDNTMVGAAQDGIAVPSVQKGRLPLLASP